jgi:hypothetical protein
VAALNLCFAGVQLQSGLSTDGPGAVVAELLNEWQLPMNDSKVGNDGYVGGLGR